VGDTFLCLPPIAYSWTVKVGEALRAIYTDAFLSLYIVHQSFDDLIGSVCKASSYFFVSAMISSSSCFSKPDHAPALFEPLFDRQVDLSLLLTNRKSLMRFSHNCISSV
jgi:hypothetical protein